MDQRQIEVETGLDERAGGRLSGGKVLQRTRHARTRFVDQAPPPTQTVPDDRWSPVLVAARLQRIAEIFHRDRARGWWPEEFKSCMPEPILERSRDYAPPTTMPRTPLTAAEIDHAVTTFEIVLRLFVDDLGAGAVIWCIANRLSFEECAAELNRMLKRRDVNRTMVRNKWLDQVGPAIADLFNSLRLPIEADDVARAERRSFHRKI